MGHKWRLECAYTSPLGVCRCQDRNMPRLARWFQEEDESYVELGHKHRPTDPKFMPQTCELNCAY